MKPDRQDCVLDLQPAQMLRLHAAAGAMINCDSGILWVTQERCTRDDFLSAGESLHIVGGGVTLVEAMGSAAAKLTLRTRHASGRLFISAFQARVAFWAPLKIPHAQQIAASGRKACPDYFL